MSDSVGRRFLRPLSAGLSLGAIFVAVVSIPLEAASGLDLTPAEVSAWIAAVYGLPSLLTMLFVLRYRQPLVLTGNIFILIFVLVLGGELGWARLVGATMLTGAIVLLLEGMDGAELGK